MILINKGTINTVVLTLTERVTVDEPVFVFKFVHDLTHEQKIFTSSDTSDFPDRYNSFTIEETESEDLGNGKVQLELGYHHYSIFQDAIDGELLEQGKVLVRDPNKVPDSVYRGGDGIQNKVYNG